MKINQRLTLCFSLLFCLLSISYASAQQLNISGVVISSEDNEPLIGATVSVKGNPTKGVITDINGQFQLSVETGTKMLVVSYVGMKTQEIRVPRKEKELKIVLISETMDIDEVVVTGYGNFSKSSFTGSANTLRTDMLKEVPVMSVEQKLQGMTTGVQITSSSGQPGANQSIRIRGMGSFNASQEPLFVIDGVPVSSGSMSSGGPDAAYMNNSKTNIMSTLNPSDIENVTVIKDAAAASLYGSRAANGVILITTKKGNTGKVRVDLNVSGGFSHAAVDFRPTLNGDQREELLYEGLLNYATDNVWSLRLNMPIPISAHMHISRPWDTRTGEKSCSAPLCIRVMKLPSPVVTTVLHSMLRSATTIRKDWPKTPVWTVTQHA